MPKKVWKIEEFDGGINQRADGRDINDNQLVEAFNVDISNKGRITMPGDGKSLYETVNAVYFLRQLLILDGDCSNFLMT